MPIEIVRDGMVVAAGALCDPCFAAAMRDVEDARKEFDALIAAGVSPERANELMIAKMNGAGAKA